MTVPATLAQPVARGAFGRRLAFLEPSMALWVVLIAVLVFLIASPMVRLVIASFQEPETGRFTLANYVEAYGSLRHLRAVANSLELGLGVALLAGLFGVPIAWAISRTDMPAKGFVRLMVFGAFITPPYLEAIALFGAPALIALPARFHVVSTQLWEFFESPVRVEEAAAFALPLLLITVLMFWLQRAILGRRGYASVTGKGGERRMIRLGPWRFVMLGYALFVCALSVLLPMAVLLQASFAKAWGRGLSF